MNKKQIKREISKLNKQLYEIENKEFESKVKVINDVCKEFCNNHELYNYDELKNEILLDGMYKDKNIVRMYIEKDSVYICTWYLNLRWWEHKPKCLCGDLDIILLDIPDEYLKNKLRKKLNKIHQWHRSRPLHEKYKN